jgi:hypothetical protein
MVVLFKYVYAVVRAEILASVRRAYSSARCAGWP